MLAVNLSLVALSDLTRKLPAALSLLAVAFAALLVAARRLRPRAAPGLDKRFLWIALLLRLPLLALPPTLSDDALRYLWDGKVAAAGKNPYLLPPGSERLAGLRDEGWRRLPHRGVPTVYPPLALAAFSIATRLPFAPFAWKALVTAADLGACAGLLALARRRGLPQSRALGYAWNPLVMLEGAGMGHVDVLGVAAALAAVLSLTPERDEAPGAEQAAVWGAASVLAKLVPAAALPMWARLSGRPLRFGAVAAALLLAAVLPVLAATGGIPPGLATFAISWEWNGPIFEPLWRFLAAVRAAPALAHGLDACKEMSGRYTLPNPLYPYLYPQFLAKALLALGVAAVVLRSLRERDGVAGSRRLFGGLLLLSSTVYPWYLLWVLPWAALTGTASWLVLSATMPLSYLARRGVPLFPWIYLGVWGPFAAVALWEWWRRDRG